MLWQEFRNLYLKIVEDTNFTVKIPSIDGQMKIDIASYITMNESENYKE